MKTSKPIISVALRKHTTMQTLDENNEFLSVQQYLENELLAMKSGKRDFFDIDELEKHLEQSIQKYED